MSIPPLQSIANATNASASRTANTPFADYRTYLQLLVTQLKHQDPTKPADPTQTVTQLATFSSLEQAVRTNDLLSALNQQSSLSQGAALIGRTITSADGAISGRVASVRLGDDGMIVKLTDGREMSLGPGISIA